MVRNTTSAGTVARTGLIRKPPGERGETDSQDERKTSILITSSVRELGGTGPRIGPVDAMLDETADLAKGQPDCSKLTFTPKKNTESCSAITPSPGGTSNDATAWMLLPGLIETFTEFVQRAAESLAL
jgi:hypothetical protein